MSESKSGINLAHPVLKAYARHAGVQPDDFRSDGSLVLRIDDRYRVQVRPAADGRLAFTSVLLDLSLRPPQRNEELFVRLAQIALGTLRDHAAGLALDTARQTLVLQQLLPASVDLAGFERSLAGFLNVLAFWQDVATREAAAASVA